MSNFWPLRLSARFDEGSSWKSSPSAGGSLRELEDCACTAGSKVAEVALNASVSMKARVLSCRFNQNSSAIK